MYKLLILMLLTVFSAGTYAQTARLLGTVTDSAAAKPIAYATIKLSGDHHTLSTVSADSAGNFVLEGVAPGQYTIYASFVGYRSHALPVVVEAGTTTLRLPHLQLVAEGKQLSTVTVTAQKALVEDKGDRLVYNAEKDISNAGSTAADVLRKVPTLTVDLNGNVEMRGNSNIKVLVNGKPSAMMARNPADALRQMPAHLIKTVEVITSPGAKYDAEGAAGVINIITKKGVQGFNGSLSATAGNMSNGILSTLALRKGKLATSFTGNVYQYRNIQEGGTRRVTLQDGQPVNILSRTTKADNTGSGIYGELGIDYDPDSSTHLNASATVWGGDFPNNNTITNRLTDPAGGELQAFRTESRFKNPYGNGQVNLGYTKTYKAEREFSLLAQYSRMPDNYFYNTDRYEDEVVAYREKSTNYSRNEEYTVQADYVYPLAFNGRSDTAKGKLEMGAKSIVRDIGSDYRVEVSPDGQGGFELDPSQSNIFAYSQRVYSGYASLRLTNQHKWNLSAGARLEHTDIEGDFKTTGTRLNNQYTNLIPSATLSKGIGKHTVKASYTQRITRPMIWYLNPWVNQSDPKNLVTGNPDLKPELNHAAELGLSLAGRKGLSVNTALYWRSTNNALEYVSGVDADGVSVSRPENIASRDAYGINVNVSAKPNKNWNLNGSGDLRYVDMSSPVMKQRNSGYVWSGNVNSTYTLPGENTVQVYANLNSGNRSLQRTTHTLSYWYGFSAKHAFWDKKASLTLGVNNPLTRGVKQESTATAPSFIAESHNLYVTRSARLTFEWRFGQLNASGGKTGKKIRNDDSGR